MAIDSSLLTATCTFGYPLAVSVTANAWRVVALPPSAPAVALQCKTAVEFGAFCFSIVDTDGPDDGDVSSGAGDYDLSNCFTFAGAVAAADRPSVSIPVAKGEGPARVLKQGRYLAISSTSSCTVLVAPLGED